MNKTYLILVYVLLICGLSCRISFCAPPLPVGTRILDPDTNFYSWPEPTISPDGRYVAYVSQGWVKFCCIEDGRINSVLEVPNSWTWPHLKAPPNVVPTTGSYGSFPRGMSRDDYDFLHSQITSTIYGFNWTHESTGFVFGVQKYGQQQRTTKTDVYLAPSRGPAKVLARGPENKVDVRIPGPSTGILTRDDKFLVSQGAQGYYRPIIWDIAKNRPRAACFLYLTPSIKSSRWIGVEKDTKQLVLLDDDFQVIQRFDATRSDQSYAFRLDWSPDEQYVLWRNQIGFDHYSNWEGFWMDLETGEKEELSGRFMGEQFGFTGHGGEFFRCGQDGERARYSGDQILGAHLTLVPDGNSAPIDLWRIAADADDPDPRKTVYLPRTPIHMPPNGDLFAIALPRPPGEKYGGFWHLIDRTGKKWRFPGQRDDIYIAPFALAGFANDGKSLVAYDEQRLFIVPLESILRDENVVQ